MQQEVTIHQSLNHKHIVQFFSYFEDENNVYIILELCRRRVNKKTFDFNEHFSFCLVINGVTSST